MEAGRIEIPIVGKLDTLDQSLSAAEQKMRQFGQRIKQVGDAMWRAFTRGAIGVAAAGQRFAVFEREMNRVRALAQPTAEQFRQLSDLAETLGAKTEFTAAQIAEAMSVMAMAGFEPLEIMQAIPSAIDLATAAQVDLRTAADVTAKMLRGMQLPASEVSRVMDVLATAVTNANADLGMLAEAFKFVGPVAASTGVSLEEVAAAIMVLHDAGIQGSLAGTAMRNLLLRLQGASPEAAKALREIGVSTTDSAGRMRPMADIIDDLRQKMAGMTDAQRQVVIAHIAGLRAVSALATMMELGGQAIRENQTLLENSQGALGRMAGTIRSGLKQAWDEAISAMDAAARAIGEALAPHLAKLFQWIAKAAAAVKRFAEAWPGLGSAIMTALVALGGLGITLKVIGSVVSGIIPAMRALIAVFRAATTSSTGFKMAVAGLIAVLGALVAITIASWLQEQVQAWKELEERFNAAAVAAGKAADNLRRVQEARAAGKAGPEDELKAVEERIRAIDQQIQQLNELRLKAETGGPGFFQRVQEQGIIAGVAGVFASDPYANVDPNIVRRRVENLERERGLLQKRLQLLREQAQAQKEQQQAGRAGGPAALQPSPEEVEKSIRRQEDLWVRQMEIRGKLEGEWAREVVALRRAAREIEREYNNRLLAQRWFNAQMQRLRREFAERREQEAERERQEAERQRAERERLQEERRSLARQGLGFIEQVVRGAGMDELADELERRRQLVERMLSIREMVGRGLISRREGALLMRLAREEFENRQQRQARIMGAGQFIRAVQEAREAMMLDRRRNDLLAAMLQTQNRMLAELQNPSQPQGVGP